MFKFMVVIYRRPDLNPAQFRVHLEEVHGPLARKLPGLKKYVQNYVCNDGKRQAPGWDAIVELYFENHESMDKAWDSPQGAASDADLPAFVDMNRTTWSVVEEVMVLE
jgi:uncharacterized protein (TIGR02118 family)